MAARETTYESRRPAANVRRAANVSGQFPPDFPDSTLAEAMQREQVRRLVCITGIGAGDSRGHGGFVFDHLNFPLLLRHVYADKDRQEAIVRESGLDWVLVRPTPLNDRPGRGSVRAFTDVSGFHGGSVARADVARFVLAQVRCDAWLGRAPLITW